MLPSLRHCAALLCAAVLLQGCATDRSLHTARSQFYSGQPQAALETLNTDKISNRNQLLAHLDRGVIAHTAGQYQQSINAFKAATAHLKQINFIGIREQSASLITNDRVISYKGEYSERLWIHTFQMMNFLLLNNPEGAAVEARQALEVYADHGDSLKNDWYSRTLLAMSFAAAGKADSAHIEYKKLLDDIGRDAGVARRAWQNARQLGREQDAEAFKSLVETKTNPDTEKGELVLFLQTGSIPRKTAGQIYLNPELFASFPIYPVIPRPDVQLSVLVDDANHSADVVTTQLVDVSREALAARGKQIAAKQIARIVAKKELARAINERVDGVGGLLTAVFFVTEQADTRSWETLPAHLSMVQIPLDAGTHNIRLLVRDGSREYELSLSNVNIESRNITYRSIRVGSGAPRIIASTALTNADAQSAIP